MNKAHINKPFKIKNKKWHRTSHKILWYKYYQQAFTIVEMLMVIGFVTALVVFLSPSLTAFLQKNKLTSEINLLNSHLQLAKSTAATEFVYVVLCPSENRTTCSNSWQAPIITFIDANHNNTVDGRDRILATHQIDSSIRLQVNRELITFAPINTAATTAVTITLCLNNYVKKALVVSNVGRIRLETDLTKVKC